MKKATQTTEKTYLDIKDVLKNGNNVVNQNIKSQFVQKHVYANVNSMVEYILKTGFESKDAPFTIDDIENYYSYPELTGKYVNFEGGTEEDKIIEFDRLTDMQDCGDYTEDEINEIQSEIDNLENLESEDQEVFEWYLVSSFLAEKLNEKGYCVIDNDNIWGRTTTGQAILLDYVITQICADMEILQGQSSSWE